MAIAGVDAVIQQLNQSGIVGNQANMAVAGGSDAVIQQVPAAARLPPHCAGHSHAAPSSRLTTSPLPRLQLNQGGEPPATPGPTEPPATPAPTPAP